VEQAMHCVYSLGDTGKQQLNRGGSRASSWEKEN